MDIWTTHSELISLGNACALYATHPTSVIEKKALLKMANYYYELAALAVA